MERDVRDGVRAGRIVDVGAGLCVRPSRELEHMKKPLKNSLGKRKEIGLVSGRARPCTGINLQALHLFNRTVLGNSRNRRKPYLTQFIEVGDRENDRKTVFPIAEF